MREYALIGVIMIVGVLAGAVYVHAVGGQPKLTLSDGSPKTQEERLALENQAIELALADPKIKPLTDVTGVKIFSTFYMTFHVVFDNETLSPVKVKLFHFEWDQKYRALVTIRYPDDTGYGVDVNITDKVVGEPKQAVWEEGKYFIYLP